MKSEDSSESLFDIGEIFFSRTDFKGKVLAGNKVFQRVSGYPWAEMQNRAHNIVRHPDMPKGVFHLFWSFLGEKRPIGAYVKNKSKDGKYYWVFAVAVPLEDGYLSVRIKPSSSMFPVIQSAYAQLKQAEIKENLSPEQSHQLLLQRISELGYEHYEKLMTECFLLELESRETKKGSKSFQIIELLKQAAALGAILATESEKILKSHKESQFLPLNLEISSSHLNEKGAAISAIASAYQKLTSEVQSEMNCFKESAKIVLSKLRENQFLMSAKYLMTEIVEFFQTEKNDSSEINISEEAKRLLHQSTLYQVKAQESVLEVLQSLKQFKMVCESMRSSITGLEIMRLTGKIEAARLGRASEAFSDIIVQLKQFQTILLSILDKIEESRFELQNCSEKILVTS